jgi:hypothetical protein
MSLAYRCGTCDGEPVWTITRRGDVVVTEACNDHLAVECARLQRDHEVTELVVVDYAKAVEYAGITRRLNEIAACQACADPTGCCLTHDKHVMPHRRCILR